jgi:hypothetical protein
VIIGCHGDAYVVQTDDHAKTYLSARNRYRYEQQGKRGILSRRNPTGVHRPKLLPVLIEERLEGPRLSTMGVFQIASEGSSQGRGFFEAIAYVDVNAEGDLMNFAETVAVNRFLPVRVFSSVSDAEKWLLGEDRAPSTKV